MDALTVSVEEAGSLLGISRGLAYRLAASGQLPTLRLGRRIVVPKPALDALLADPHAFAERGREERRESSSSDSHNRGGRV